MCRDAVGSIDWYKVVGMFRRNTTYDKHSDGRNVDLDFVSWMGL